MPADSTTRALDGITVVSLAAHLPGPLAARQLMALGADIVKVEPPDGDPFAGYHQAWYDALVAGQQVIRLDLKNPATRPAFNALLAAADVFITSTRPSSLARLGLSWLTLHEQYPRLCQVAIVGSVSPNADRPGHDLTYQASAGLTDPPQMPAMLVADFAGAERAVSATLALVLARERGAGAGYAEVGLSQAASDFAEPARRGVTLPGAVFGGGVAGYNLYRASDGWIALGALESNSWSAIIADAGSAGDPVTTDGVSGTAAATRRALEAYFKGKTAASWEAWAVERGLPIVAVRAPGDRAG